MTLDHSIALRFVRRIARLRLIANVLACAALVAVPPLVGTLKAGSKSPADRTATQVSGLFLQPDMPTQLIGRLLAVSSASDSTETGALPLSQADAESIAHAAMALPDTVAHSDDPVKSDEHAQLLALVPRSAATHVAVASGDWFDASTWYQGRIPGAGARALIAEDISVRYNGESDASLFTVRVDGTLSFATDTNTRLVLDTLVISPMGSLVIGTVETPVQPEVTASILIADNGAIDTGWDPLLLSRGVISHGHSEIFGAAKTAFVKVAVAPTRGKKSLLLASEPLGWRVGDTLIVSGTHKRGWAWDNDAGVARVHESEDELVKITAIDGSKITIDRTFRFNHDTPRSDLFAYVANMTRNITFASQQGAATPLQDRGHVMFMHGHDIDVRYAAFNDLGRTDKSREAFDVSAIPSILPDSNIKGRYPLHFHKTGTEDLAHPAVAIGNTISGSPGWGIAQHSSNADLIDNVTFEVFGAAYAAEDGDETGIWLRNMAIRSVGFASGDSNTKLGIERHDNGRTGDGFFFAGRLVEAVGNVAVNTTHGFVWMVRSAPTGPLATTLEHPEIAYGAQRINPANAPIQGFRDNEAFGTETGIIIVKAESTQGHDVRSVLDGFLNWETRIGVNISYSGHYTLLNFDLIGTRGTGFFEPEMGSYFGANAFDIVMNRWSIEGFPIGTDLASHFNSDMPDADIGFVLIDVQMKNVAQPYVNYSAENHSILTAADLVRDRLTFDFPAKRLGPNQDLSLLGTKRDSIGQTNPNRAADTQTIWRWDVPALLKSTGYYTTADGGKVALIPDLVADRATGRLKKFSFPVQLDFSTEDLQGLGAQDHGLYDPLAPAPVAKDDVALTAAGQDVAIDVIGNDHIAGNRPLRVDGTVAPFHGTVFRAGDGSLIYRPDAGFSGDDHFSYWASAGTGTFTPAMVKITVAAQ